MLFIAVQPEFSQTTMLACTSTFAVCNISTWPLHCLRWAPRASLLYIFARMVCHACATTRELLPIAALHAGSLQTAKLVTFLRTGAASTQFLLIPCTKCSNCSGIDEYAALAAFSVDGAACSCAADPRTAKTSLSFTSRRRDLLLTGRQVTRPLPTGVSPARTGSSIDACIGKTKCRIALSGLMRLGLLFNWSVTDHLSGEKCAATRLRNICEFQVIEGASAQDRGTVLCSLQCTDASLATLCVTYVFMVVPMATTAL